jgi:hypothetical protein
VKNKYRLSKNESTKERKALAPENEHVQEEHDTTPEASGKRKKTARRVC